MRSLSHAFVALSLAVVGLLGCSKDSAPGAAQADGAKIKIGFIVKQPDEPWFQLEWQFADEAAKKNGFEILRIAAPDGDKVLSAIDSLSTNGAQGFVICTPDTKLGPAIAAAAKSHGLKVMAVDDQFLSAGGQPMSDVPYLGISAGKIGNSVGQTLLDEMARRKWTAEGTGLCVVTYNELDTARQRTDGAVETIKASGFPVGQIYFAPQKTTDIPGASNAMDILLTQQPNVRRWLICGMNDSAVLGAVRSTEAHGINADNVIGVGIDGTECIDELKKANKTGFYASALLSARDHGYKTSELMYHWIHDNTTPPMDTRTSGIIITRENFKQVLQEQGLSK